MEEPSPTPVVLGSAAGFVISADCTGNPASATGVDLRVYAQTPGGAAQQQGQLHTVSGIGANTNDLGDSQVNASDTEIALLNDASGGDPGRAFYTGILSGATGPVVNLTLAMLAGEGLAGGACTVKGTAIPTG
jgi:hypothetical protein